MIKAVQTSIENIGQLVRATRLGNNFNDRFPICHTDIRTEGSSLECIHPDEDGYWGALTVSSLFPNRSEIIKGQFRADDDICMVAFPLGCLPNLHLELCLQGIG